MKRYIRFVTALALCGVMAVTASCKEKDNDSSSEEKSNSSAVVTTAENTEKSGNTTTAAESTGTTTTTEPVTVTMSENGYPSAQEAAQNYYNAYITNNYEAIYNMFSQDEITAYHAYVDSAGLIGEEKADKAFGKGNVMKAIKASIGNIRSIMAEKSDKPAEQWATSFKAEDLAAVSPEELAQYNSTLGTAFTNAMNCGYVYYNDGDDRNSFVGNACSLVEKDGRWYLSYSTILSAELITFLDIY
ncbi:MAG: hypothetical protein IJ779_03930 [Ruminococcus sp.]|nr:hypothetical protein [Ruminococcus sp.]